MIKVCILCGHNLSRGSNNDNIQAQNNIGKTWILPMEIVTKPEEAWIQYNPLKELKYSAM